MARLISRSVVKPIVNVTEAARHIAATEDLGRRIEVTSQDEVGELAQHFNAMLDTLAGSIEAQRQLVADASHELRTPITSLRTNIEVLAESDELPPDERARLLADVEEQTAELGALVGDLIELARGDEPVRETEDVRLDELVEEAVARARRHAPRVHFEATIEPAVVEGTRERLARAVNNLLDNAATHSSAGGVVEVAVGAFGLRVRDHGTGIAEEDLPHLFDRFYRGATARQRPGSGLGLAIVRQVAEQHGGLGARGERCRRRRGVRARAARRGRRAEWPLDLTVPFGEACSLASPPWSRSSPSSSPAWSSSARTPRPHRRRPRAPRRRPSRRRRSRSRPSTTRGVRCRRRRRTSAAPRRSGCGSRSSCTTSSRRRRRARRTRSCGSPRSRFAAEMAALKQAGYYGITLHQAFEAWDHGAPLPRKPVVVSFDDGYLSQYTHARPVLRKLGWPGVLNLEWNNLGPGGVTQREVKVMLGDGWELDSHTVTHPDLTTVSDAQLQTELVQSRKDIRDKFGAKTAEFFCYPSGHFDDRVVAAVKAAGYRGATTTQLGLGSRSAPFTLNRVRVDGSDTAASLLSKLRAAA